MNFARGIIKHRDDLRYADPGAEARYPPLGKGRAQKRPCRSTIHFVGNSRRDTHLEGASLEQAAEEPATPNGFREPRMQRIPRVDHDFHVNKIPIVPLLRVAALRTW